ncbi:MAG: hypothetical protein NVS4B11_23830 [Ktedonobacteraceae bacterium]
MKWVRSRIIRELLLLLLLAVLLIVGDEWCYTITLPVELDVQHAIATLHVGTTQLVLGHIGTPTALQFAAHDSVIHEYQMDGTDSTNNFTLDTEYFHMFSSSPYYRFQAWMRNLDGTSRWRDLRIWAGNAQQLQQDWPMDSGHIALPLSSSLRVQVQVQRPETPLILNLLMKDGSTLHITLDRNNRHIRVTREILTQGNTVDVASAFFPTDTAPFAAMVVDTLLRTTLWAILLLFIVLVGESMLVTTRSLWRRDFTRTFSPAPHDKDDIATKNTYLLKKQTQLSQTSIISPLKAACTSMYNGWQYVTEALHPFALLALGISFFFVAWIAAVQYHGEPHIFDASAYLFAAKMYALGHLSVPVPPAIDRFPGPFMLQFNGRWFGQYAPGTALTLVPGIWLGVPWLVEPLLGTFALFGIGLIAAQLYNRQVATLAVILGTLSPFYTYLAASYLSHTIALFYFVWGLWALLRFAQGKANWNMALAAAFFGMAGLTRDLVALLFVAVMLPGVLLLSWNSVRKEWKRWIVGGTFFLVVALFFLGISLGFNTLLTGNAYVTPRSLFFEGDHWGFGQGVGFYGQHTLAAGFVNLDELLTILAIDLFGWPFYLSFAFLVMPFLTRRAVGADWLCLAGAVIMTGAYIGYFYHGIYLGPRYLFETLPFLLILTSHGILTLAETGASVRADQMKVMKQATNPGTLHAAPSHSVVTAFLLAILIACNILYFMPRQVALHQNYSGLPAGTTIDLDTIYHPQFHNAIIVTGDYSLYQFVLFPLNDPYLHDSVIYALASTPLDYAELHAAYPGRTLYRLEVGVDGLVTYTVVKS